MSLLDLLIVAALGCWVVLAIGSVRRQKKAGTGCAGCGACSRCAGGSDALGRCPKTR
ncbi:MAG: FeoB-associated Cys-rich membrane protein [Clostridia bacterium]